jgi:hypothetical protein
MICYKEAGQAGNGRTYAGRGVGAAQEKTAGATRRGMPGVAGRK